MSRDDQDTDDGRAPICPDCGAPARLGIPRRAATGP